MPLTQEPEILGPIRPGYEKILTPDALGFISTLHSLFEDRRQKLIAARATRQSEIDSGIMPDFLEETSHIRADTSWIGPPPAPGLVDRRVEITGPVDRKMVINALNSAATQYMADFEDSTSPTWSNVIEGQINMYDAVRRSISYEAPNGRQYKLNNLERIPTLLVRPRGWHLHEAHIRIGRKPVSASLFDFGMYFFHNAKEAIRRGIGPYFYLPKLEGHQEARLWNDVFNISQEYLGIPRGTIRATVLIETILGAFEMEEIIFELKDHSAGLNCGRWDYIFSFIKKFRSHPEFVLPDRATVTMAVPFMAAYVDHLIQVCHKRGVHAMGGMSAQIPIKNDPEANTRALTKVYEDKLREVLAGHDGTWVAHPDLIPIAMEVFNKHMPQPHQIARMGSGSRIVCREDLLRTLVPDPITMEGIRSNVKVALVYMESWLRGFGCVPINDLMEDAATAEIARSQLWQWLHHRRCTTDSGILISMPLLEKVINEIFLELYGAQGAPSSLKARHHLIHMIKSPHFIEFLTTLCYDDIVQTDSSPHKSKF